MLHSYLYYRHMNHSATEVQRRWRGYLGRKFFRLYVKVCKNRSAGKKEFKKPNAVKPVLSGHSKRTSKMVFNTNYRLMQVKSIAECSKGSILQFFQPTLSYHLSLRALLYLFLRSHLRQVLLCFMCFWLEIQ